MPRVIQVIELKEKRGSGKEGSPFRWITAYYDFEGNRLASEDEYWPDKEELFDFILKREDEIREILDSMEVDSK